MKANALPREDAIEIAGVRFSVVGFAYRESLARLADRINENKIVEGVIVKQKSQAILKWDSGTRSHYNELVPALVWIEGIDLRSPTPENTGLAVSIQMVVDQMTRELKPR